MSKKNENKGLSVMGQFTLDKVPSMLEQVNAKIKELKGERENTTRINDSLGVFGKISDIKDPLRLVDAYAFITRKAAAYAEFLPVFKEIGLADPKPFSESGHSLKTWQEEIKAQYRDVTFGEQLGKLEKAKQLLTDNLSAEQKFIASMGDIADLFA